MWRHVLISSFYKLELWMILVIPACSRLNNTTLQHSKDMFPSRLSKRYHIPKCTLSNHCQESMSELCLSWFSSVCPKKFWASRCILFSLRLYVWAIYLDRLRACCTWYVRRMGIRRRGMNLRPGFAVNWLVCFCYMVLSRRLYGEATGSYRGCFLLQLKLTWRQVHLNRVNCVQLTNACI